MNSNFYKMDVISVQKNLDHVLLLNARNSSRYYAQKLTNCKKTNYTFTANRPTIITDHVQ